jgi:hypothetical protein
MSSSSLFHPLEQMGAVVPDSLDDPIIQQILSDLGIDMTLMTEEEVERHRRLCSMLRHSKRYKRFRVDDANKRWDEDSISAQNDLCISDVSEDTATDWESEGCLPPPHSVLGHLRVEDSDIPSKRRVSFSDKVRVIHLSNHSLENFFGDKKTESIKNLEQFMRHLKSFFRRSC